MSKYRTPFIALAGAMLLGSAAQAVTYTTSPGAPDPGPAAGENVLVDFNAALPAGFTLTGDFAYATGTSDDAAAPAGDMTRYLYVSSAIPNGSATLTSALDLTTLSVYWGSIDTYNSVDILGANGVTLFSLSGAALPPANGDRGASATNQRVFFTASAGEVITGIRFNSTGVAFEVDDVAGSFDGSGSDVPEPESWALMVAGFGLIGVAARRRKRMHSVTA